MQKVVFSGFELDLEKYSLTRDQRPIAIGQRCLDLLLFLLENRDRFVAAEILRMEVWKGAKLSDSTISTCIRELRILLGDQAGDPRIIFSKWGRGYRFIAPAEFVRKIEASAGGAPGRMPFMGRSEELSILRSAARAALVRRRGMIVVLRGEAGVGKTRLLEEFLNLVDANTNKLVGRCIAGLNLVEFVPWRKVLTDAARLLPRLEGRIQQPELLEMELPHGGRDASEGSRPNRLDVFRKWTDAIRAITEVGPAVIAIEDIHHADASTLHLVGLIAEALVESPLLLVVTHRPRPSSEPVAASIEDICALENCEIVDLGAMSSPDIDSIIRPMMMHEQIDAIELQRVTAGNPLLLESSIRNFQIRETKPNQGSILRELAANIVDATVRIVSDLPIETRELLVTSAVIGDRFSGELVSSISGIESLEAARLLEPAVKARILSEEGGSFHFRHPLIREALPLRLASMRRKEIHARIAEHLRGMADQSSVVCAVARHLASAVPVVSHREAVEGCVLAVLDSRARLDHEGFYEFASVAMDIASLDSATTTSERCRLEISLAQAKEALGDRAASRTQLLEVARISRAERLFDVMAECALAMSQDFASIDVGVHDVVVERLLRESLDQTPPEKLMLRAQLQARLSLALRWSGSFEEQELFAQGALDLANQCGERDAMGDALSAIAETLHGPMNAERRLQALADLERILPQEIESEATLLQHTRKITALLEVGDLDRIANINRSYRALAEKTGQLRHAWYAITTDSMRSLMKGDMSLPVELESHFHLICQAGGDPNVSQGYFVQRFFREVECGNSSEILPMLRQVVEEYPLVTTWRSALAWLYWDMGNEDDAIRQLSFFTPERIAAMAHQVGSGAGLGMLAEVAASFGSDRIKEYLYELLEPMDRFCATAGYGVLYMGSFARHAGVLARSIGNRGRAIELLSLAANQEAARGAELWRAYSLVDLAVTIGLRDNGLIDAESVIGDADRIVRGIRVPRLNRRIREAKELLALPLSARGSAKRHRASRAAR